VNTQEREFVLKHLHESRDRFLRAVSGLSQEQLVFQPGEDRWSIADCAEHIGMVENVIYERIHKALGDPPAPEKQAEVQAKTEHLLSFVPNRTTRVKGPERLMPRREWKEFYELVLVFESARARTIEFAAQTDADLHCHFFPHMVFQDLDCYQWLMLAALHGDRHVLQMEEVMASPGYPQRAAGQVV
jgi:hypothetical protein